MGGDILPRAASGPQEAAQPAGLFSIRSGFHPPQQIPLADNAKNAASPVHYRQAADTVLGHQTDRLQQRRVRADCQHRMGHDFCGDHGAIMDGVDLKKRPATQAVR